MNLLIKHYVNNAVKIYSDKTAIKYKDKSYSYADVKKHTESMKQIIKCQKKEKVIILLDRSFELVITILTAIELDMVFIPLDIKSPTQKIADIIKEVNPSYVITNNTMIGVFSKIIPFQNLKLEYYASVIIVNTSRVFQTDIFEEDDRYIYFTSGSSGTPKGILGRDSSLCNFINWEIRTLDVSHEMNVSQLTNPSFDPFLRDIFVPLFSGGTICIPDDEIIKNPYRLIQWILDMQINIIHIVPHLFRLLSKYMTNSQYMPHLKFVLLAGEILRGQDVKAFMEKCMNNVQLINLYGPTETTLAKFCYKIDKNDIDKSIMPVGKPIDNYSDACIYDEDFHVCPDGSNGTIFISSLFTSRGYYNNKLLTDELFTKDPRLPDFIQYNTGDIGTIDSNGNLIVIGRNDNQVKIAGRRVCLEEIEAQIANAAGISNCIVFRKSNQDEDMLVLWACLETNQDIDTRITRKKLLEYLPEYMIPVSFVTIDKMPINNNGKIDRKKVEEIALKLLERANQNISLNDPVTLKVIEYIREKADQNFRLEDKNTNNSITDIFHSINYIGLLVNLEEEFDIEIPDTFLDISNFKNLPELIDSINEIVEKGDST